MGWKKQQTKTIVIPILDESHRNHTLTESRHIYSLTQSLQSLFYFFLIVSFFNLSSKYSTYFVNILQ